MSDAKQGQFVEQRCWRFHSEGLGPTEHWPGVHVRMLLVGFFERLGSERGIAWRSLVRRDDWRPRDAEGHDRGHHAE